MSSAPLCPTGAEGSRTSRSAGERESLQGRGANRREGGEGHSWVGLSLGSLHPFSSPDRGWGLLPRMPQRSFSEGQKKKAHSLCQKAWQMKVKRVEGKGKRQKFPPKKNLNVKCSTSCVWKYPSCNIQILNIFTSFRLETQQLLTPIIISSPET